MKYYMFEGKKYRVADETDKSICLVIYTKDFNTIRFLPMWVEKLFQHR